MRGKHIAFIFALTFAIIMLSCANIFAPSVNTVDDSDISRKDYDELILYGKEELYNGRYGNAMAYFDAAIGISNKGTLARYYASKTLMDARFSRNIVPIFVNFIGNMSGGGGSGNPLADIITMLASFDSNELILEFTNTNSISSSISTLETTDFSNSGGMILTNKLLKLVVNYLNDYPNASLVYGYCDDEVATNNVFANINLIIVYLFNMQSTLFTSDGEFNTELFEGITESFSDVSSIASSLDISSLGYNSLISLTNTLKTTHDTIESLISTLMLLNDLREVTRAISRIESRVTDTNAEAIIDGVLSNVGVDQMLETLEPMFSTIDTVLSFGETLNSTHYTLVGDYAYTQGNIAGFVPSSWDTHSGGLKGEVVSMISNIESITSSLGGINPSSLSNVESITNILSQNPEALSNFMVGISNTTDSLSNTLGSLTNLGGDSIDLGSLFSSDSNSSNLSTNLFSPSRGLR